MNRSTGILNVLIFLSFIGVFFILNILMPDKDFSERENRYLEQMPDLNLSSLLAGKFSSDFENYASDQFTLRDTWTTVKARAETLVGKTENRGVYLCKDNRLIERFEINDKRQMALNIKAVHDFASKQAIPVYFALIPSAAGINWSSLPKNAPSDNQLEVIKTAYDGFPGKSVDVYAALESHAAEYIYYRTDHHWTSLGAYYGYTALMSAFGFEQKQIDSYDRKIVSDSFYGTLFSSSGFSWIPPDDVELFVNPSEYTEVINYSSGSAETGMIYDSAFLEKKDKYSMFMGGNTPLAVIDTGISDAPSLLVIRDSYMDSLTPFLLDHFSMLHIIDLRYYKNSLHDYIAESGVKNILICLGISNFVSERNLFLLGQ